MPPSLYSSGIPWYGTLAHYIGYDIIGNVTITYLPFMFEIAFELSQVRPHAVSSDLGIVENHLRAVEVPHWPHPLRPLGKWGIWVSWYIDRCILSCSTKANNTRSGPSGSTFGRPPETAEFLIPHLQIKIRYIAPPTPPPRCRARYWVGTYSMPRLYGAIRYEWVQEHRCESRS